MANWRQNYGALSANFAKAPNICEASDQVAAAMAPPVVFVECGTGVERVDGGSGVRQTKDRTSAFALARVDMRGGSASATFRPVFEGDYGYQIGVFPADLRLDSDTGSADGKRCALYVEAGSGGYAQVHCDGVESGATKVLGWRSGDTIKVDVTFKGSAARVTLSAKGKTWSETLQGVPACGLRFGAGLSDEKDSGVTVLASSVDPVG